MIIDAHTHLSEGLAQITGPRAREAATPASYARAFAARLTALGVDRALVFTVEGLYGDCSRHNDELHRLSQEAPDVLRPFCTVNPRDGDAAVEELRRCVEELGMLGVKFHPWLQAFPPVHAGMAAIVEETIRLRVPMLFHDGTPPYSAPLQIADLARRFPEAVIILGHSGLHDMWIEAVRAAERYQNVCLCTAGATLQGVRQALLAVGPGRVMFGTDFPMLDDAGVILHRRLVEEAAGTEEARRQVLSGTALQVLPQLRA